MTSRQEKCIISNGGELLSVYHNALVCTLSLYSIFIKKMVWVGNVVLVELTCGNQKNTVGTEYVVRV